MSVSNKDPTAEELRRLLSLAFTPKEKKGVLCWNAIPWFTTDKPSVAQVREATVLHGELLELLRPKLQYVLLLGQWARWLLPFCSTRVGSAHIYGGHHPSAQAKIQRGLADENEKLFRHLRSIK